MGKVMRIYAFGDYVPHLLARVERRVRVLKDNLRLPPEREQLAARLYGGYVLTGKTRRV